MLYTFSQAVYDATYLRRYLIQTTAQDAILLWQDGVLLALKYPALFANSAAPCYALESDVTARGISALMPAKVRSISLELVVELSEKYTPQFAL
ncbi:sulfurtransferase complex subunit TusB [Necropsobacter massiliensis]|uniref:sulfurtransferase complex subunit TusB n=1 Tax=Necropsobacter massiliensis TaxID=1400001 RepID=UPI000595BEAC|nr:sulfurtransferase complex subunit TusB [Necropsobacter massiliensis]